MKRLVLVAVTAAALTGAGYAIATDIAVKSIKSVTATFAATNVSRSSTRTCTNEDGTFTLTRAVYSGTASSSDPSLNGPIALDVTSVINTPKNIGTLTGRLRIDTASGRDTTAGFNATYSNGQTHGLASGRAHAPYERLLANLSSGFSATGGFTNGKIGATDGNGAAIEWAPGRCKPTQKPKPERVEAKGKITAVSSTSISVAGVTCVVPSSLQAKVSALKVNDQVEIKCEVMNGQLTLTKVEKKHDDDD